MGNGGHIVVLWHWIGDWGIERLSELLYIIYLNVNLKIGNG